jgi:hypothetical protein
MARREPMKVRTLRCGENWDRAQEIAEARGHDFAAWLRSQVDMYVELAGPPPDDEST